jgi:hypothetical protein
MKPLKTDLVDAAVASLAVAAFWGALNLSRAERDPCEGLGDPTQCEELRFVSVGGRIENLLTRQNFLMAGKWMGPAARLYREQ